MDATSQTIREKAKRISPLDPQWGGALSRRGDPIFSRAQSCKTEQFRQQPGSKRRAIHMVNGHQRAGLREGVSATLRHQKVTASADYELRHEDCVMRPWVHRVSYPSTALQYIGDIFLNLLIAASGMALLMLSVFFFA
jgi:hypothetical protein